MNNYDIVYNAVWSAMSGNGKLSVNHFIKQHLRIMRKMKGYSAESMHNIYDNFTRVILIQLDEYDKDIDSLQGWINWKVLEFLDRVQDRPRKKRPKKIKATATNENVVETSVVYTHMIDSFPDEYHLNPEELMILKDTEEKLMDRMDDTKKRIQMMLLTLSGEYTIREAAEELNMSKDSFFREFNIFKIKLSSYLNDETNE